MIRLRVEVDRMWAAGDSGVRAGARPGADLGELLDELVRATGIVIVDWGDTHAAVPSETVTILATADTTAMVRAVQAATAGWVASGAVHDVRIGVGGKTPMSVRPTAAARPPTTTARPPAAAAQPSPAPAPPPDVVLRDASWLEDLDAPAGGGPTTARPPADRGPGVGAEPPAVGAGPPAAARPQHATPGEYIAYGLLRGPAEVVVAAPFVLDVGLAPRPQAGVAGGRMLPLPTPGEQAYVVDVRIAAPGFTFAPGQAQRRALEVSAKQPYPAVKVSLIPKALAGGAAVDRPITAEYSFGGERLGDAIRYVQVVGTTAGRTRPATDRVEAGVDVGAPTGPEVADLTLTIRNSDPPGFAEWTFDSPHRDVVKPLSKPLRSPIGDAAAFLQASIEQIDAAEGTEGGIYDDVLALANRVRSRIPDGVWTAIRAVATKRQAAPTILLLSEDPFVPWELAEVDPPLLPGSTDPPFLAAQTRIGRWVQATDVVDGRARPSPLPPQKKDVASIGVVWGSYAKTDWTDLAHAAKEAKDVIRLYGGQAIKPTNHAMFDLLRGTPAPDLLHFAVHGRYNPQDPGAESGIILTDGQSLHDGEIASHDLTSNPVVFLNACQVGAGRLDLGSYSGIAAAFVEAGASAVVAPLWKIDDGIARTIALDFYRQVAGGVPLSEVLRVARAQFVDVYETKSATWMAYQLFGHPSFVVGGLKTG